MNQSNTKTILLTAFEPSGDRLGASVTRALLDRDSSLKIQAFGGPRLAQAGAQLLEDTCANPVMGIPGPRVIAQHLALNRRIRSAMDTQIAAGGIDLHIAVDSPAANFPACKLSRARGLSIVHLAAPQLWAWAPWRIRKLRRLTDHLLCLLPFEEDWFTSRGVPATFIGHPVFDEPIDTQSLDEASLNYPAGSPKLGLLPGSREKELRLNFPLQLDTFRTIQREHPDLAGIVAAVDDSAANKLKSLAKHHGGWPTGLEMRIDEVEPIIHWSDLCLTVSGTVTLQVLKHATPMIVHFKANRFMYHAIARWLLTAKHLALPNLIAGKAIVPELMPYFGNANRLANAARTLLNDSNARQTITTALEHTRENFVHTQAAQLAADGIQKMLAKTNGPGGT